MSVVYNLEIRNTEFSILFEEIQLAILFDLFSNKGRDELLENRKKAIVECDDANRIETNRRIGMLTSGQHKESNT